MISLVPVLWPELLLIVAAFVLFLLGIARSAGSRGLRPSSPLERSRRRFSPILLARPLTEAWTFDQWRHAAGLSLR